MKTISHRSLNLIWRNGPSCDINRHLKAPFLCAALPNYFWHGHGLKNLLTFLPFFPFFPFFLYLHSSYHLLMKIIQKKSSFRHFSCSALSISYFISRPILTWNDIARYIWKKSFFILHVGFYVVLLVCLCRVLFIYFLSNSLLLFLVFNFVWFILLSLFSFLCLFVFLILRVRSSNYLFFWISFIQL